MSAWEQWVRHPESVRPRQTLFNIHLWLGVVVGLYVLVMGITGSMLVCAPQLERSFPGTIALVEWLKSLHENLLFGDDGRLVNGLGAICVALLCLTGAIIWWPGIGDWRRSLTVNWRNHIARVNWDLHSALGFWCFFFVSMWGLSGFYMCFPETVNALFGFIDPRDRFTTTTLYWLSALHFGRFGWFGEALWILLGLVLAVLSVTGVYLSCHRLIHKSAPKAAKPQAR
jgi:uncharacterized iron-regulated membrane protein